MNSIEYDFLKIVSEGEITDSSNPIDIIELVKLGLNATAIYQLGRVLQWEAVTLAKSIGTTVKTLEYHRKNKTPLDISVSEKAIELARLSTIMIGYFGNIERWNMWLSTPNMQFYNKTPQSFAHTVCGRELIKRIVLDLEHGFVA